MDASGRRLAKARLPEGMAGMTRLHAMIGQALGDDIEDDAAQVKIGIETDRGPWVQALIAAGYTVYAVNPLQAARYRERLAVSGAKSDAADAHMLADMVRTDAHQLRPIAGDSGEAELGADQRGPQTGPPPRHPSQGRGDPGRAARRAPRPAPGGHRRLRRIGARSGRAADHPQGAGRGPFWPAPGR